MAAREQVRDFVLFVYYSPTDQGFVTVSDTSRKSVDGGDNRRIIFPRTLPERIHSMVGKILRRIDFVSGRFADEKQGASNSFGKCVLASCDSNPAKSVSFNSVEVDDIPFSPLSWQFSEELTADSRFIGLVILSANHRAGSTLLQRICNAREKTLIWGEHNALLRHFADIYDDADRLAGIGGEEREIFFKKGKNPNLWIGSMSPELEYAQRAIVESARRFLCAYYNHHESNHDLIGFKEVQYGRGELELLRRCYPAANIFLLIRNPINTWNSTPLSWYPSLDDWIEKWVSRVRCFRRVAAGDPHCHLIRYEDLVRQDEQTMEIICETAKISRKQLKMVLAKKIGKTKGAIDVSGHEVIRERCRDEMEAMGYI